MVSFAMKILRRMRIGKRFVLWLVLAMTAGSVSMLYAIGLAGRQVPELTEVDIGTPFRAASGGGFKASRDFEVVDERRTAADREAEKAKVRPVFDYSPRVESDARDDVHETFAKMREVLSLTTGAGGKRGSTKEELLLERAKRDAPRDAAASRVLPPTEEDFEALVRGRFSEETENAVLALIEHTYQSMIAISREELLRSGPGGITVRTLGTNREFQQAMNAPQVVDIREAGMELERASAVLLDLPGSTPTLRRALLHVARNQLRPNLTINTAETEARRQAAAQAVKPAFIAIKKGQRIIGDGELITATHVLVLNGLRAQTKNLDLVQQKVGVALLVGIILGILWIFLSSASRQFRPSVSDAAFMAALGVALLAGLQGFVIVAEALHDRYPQLPVEALHYAFPGLAGAMLVGFLISSECALYFAISFSLLAGMVLGNSASFAVYTLVASILGAFYVSKVRERAGFFRAGWRVGGIAVLTLLGTSLAGGKPLWSDLLWQSGGVLVSASIVAPMLVLALTPLIEAAFGYASDLKLLELANLNHPALKELVLQAPGTYHHSIIMGTLVEAAAEAIGANALLARSCAYYHDIGKGRNPGYFAENQKGENPHDQLPPTMSATIIKRHVTDGQEMARQYKLPKKVADAIPQHHGTRLVGYFAHKFKAELASKGGEAAFEEAPFRYAGPIPQFREAALVMIADACEAASRSMVDHEPEALKALVRKLINTIFTEGQLDECDLNLRDLHVVAESFSRALSGIYHARPPYPAEAVSASRGSAEGGKVLTVLKGGDEDRRAAT